MSRTFFRSFIVFGLLTVCMPVNQSQASVESYLQSAHDRYQEIATYQAYFDREEYDSGKRVKSEEIFMRFEKPFHIFMKWNSGGARGQQIVFAEGYFEDKLLVRPPGFFFEFLPIVQLELDDPRLGEGGEKRSVRHAGIGYFLEKFIQDYEEAMLKSQVSFTQGEVVSVGDEQGKKIIYDFSVPGREYPRVEIVFSDEHQLPLEIVMQSDSGKKEIYRYRELQVNADRSDDGFRSAISPKLINQYLSVANPTV